jgi:hypothetical protein
VTACAKPNSGERRSQRALELAAQRRAVERRGGRRLVRVHRLALDELPLDGVKRRELVMLRLERAHVAFDREQRREKVLEVRPRRSAAPTRPCAKAPPARPGQRQASPPARRRRLQMRDETCVDAHRSVHRIKVGKRESVRKLERRDGFKGHGTFSQRRRLWETAAGRARKTLNFSGFRALASGAMVLSL